MLDLAGNPTVINETIAKPALGRLPLRLRNIVCPSQITMPLRGKAQIRGRHCAENVDILAIRVKD
ncbi:MULTISPECIES: hypothetical protein [unclassified Marinovum]